MECLEERGQGHGILIRVARRVINDMCPMDWSIGVRDDVKLPHCSAFHVTHTGPSGRRFFVKDSTQNYRWQDHDHVIVPKNMAHAIIQTLDRDFEGGV